MPQNLARLGVVNLYLIADDERRAEKLMNCLVAEGALDA